MATPENDITNAENKEQRSVWNIKITDGKITANYEVYEKSETEEWTSPTRYDKIFDDFDGFIEYTQKFFKL